jgi:hypothetical protein
VITSIALAAGAIWLRRRGGSGRQVVLMLVLAVVIAINVAIWILPAGDGGTLIGNQPR